MIRLLLFFLFLISLLQSTIVYSYSQEPPKSRHDYIVNDNSIPKNTRHLSEGYYIGSIPKSIKQIESLYYDYNIRLIITLTHTKQSFSKIVSKINDLNIDYLYLPIGSRFPVLTFEQKSLIIKHDPNQIYVHCDHGADRSGAFIAYLLILRNNYTIPKALLSITTPRKKDQQILMNILSEYGYSITDDDLQTKSIYAGNGGLKLRGDTYVRLVKTFLNNLTLNLK